jgi:hypothetical protein
MFHDNENKGMNLFQLPLEVRPVIINVGKNRGKPEGREEAKNLFNAHLVDELLQIWKLDTADGIPGELTEVPGGLVSFMYWVGHDTSWNQAFRKDAPAVMARFRLSDEVCSQIVNIGANHDGKQGRELTEALFENHLVGEVLRDAPRPKFW